MTKHERDYRLGAVTFTRLMWTVIGFCMPWALGVVFNVGIYGFLAAVITAVAAFLVSGAAEKKTSSKSRLDAGPGATSQLPLDTGCSQWEVTKAAEFVRNSMVPAEGRTQVRK